MKRTTVYDWAEYNVSFIVQYVRSNMSCLMMRAHTVIVNIDLCG